MPDTFPVTVETAPAELPGEPLPLRFHLGRRSLDAKAILDQWPGADHLYVKLLASDGATYILRHDLARDCWQLVLFERVGPNRATTQVVDSS